MTATEFYINLLQELRSHHTTTLTPIEFNHLIESSMYQWVQTRFYAFEQHQKHIDDLEQIVVVTNGAGGMPNPLNNLGELIPGKEYFIPNNSIQNNDKLFLINVRFLMTANQNCTEKYEDAQLKKTDFMTNKNAYDKPSNTNIYYQQRGGKIFRYDLGQSNRVAKNAIITYLRKPIIPLLDANGNGIVDPEFNDMVCTEIIKFTVATYLERITSQRQRSFQSDQAGVFNMIAPAAKK